MRARQTKHSHAPTATPTPIGHRTSHSPNTLLRRNSTPQQHRFCERGYTREFGENMWTFRDVGETVSFSITHERVQDSALLSRLIYNNNSDEPIVVHGISGKSLCIIAKYLTATPDDPFTLPTIDENVPLTEDYADFVQAAFEMHLADLETLINQAIAEVMTKKNMSPTEVATFLNMTLTTTEEPKEDIKFLQAMI